MSAPISRDPLVVNTQDGCCWTRRAVNCAGRGLYALADVRGPVPELVLASLADVLPVPVGPKPQADSVAAGRGLDLLALMDEHAASVVSPVLAAVLDEAERLRARVAELEAERHVTNEALDDAVQALRADRGRIPEPETGHAAPAEDVSPQVEKLRALLAGQRAALEDPHDGPLAHQYRVPRDLPDSGGAR